MSGEGTALNYVFPDNVLSRTVGDELVLVDLDRELYFSLNTTGAEILSALQERTDLDEIVAKLAAHGATPEQARDDVDQLIRQLVSVGLLTAD